MIVLKSLEEIYKFIESISGPKAILDFVSGELGNEVFIAQALGGKFYDKHKNYAKVIALTWYGCSPIFSNVSDYQIEFADEEISVEWNRNHFTTGKMRFDLLLNRGHYEKIESMPDIIARLGPYWLSDGTSIGSFSKGKFLVKNNFVAYYNWYWENILERLTKTKPIFESGSRIVQESYISIFDRNEKHQPSRNTAWWQIEMFYGWANALGLKLVVISDLYPRELPEGILHFHSSHRDMKTLCNLVNNSLLHASPSSGASELAMIFGCNFLQLCYFAVTGHPEHYDPIIFRSMLKSRGYNHFGVLSEDRGSSKNLRIEKECLQHLESAKNTQ